MENIQLWQYNAVEDIGELLGSYDEVQAVILKGSVGSENASLDRWSDIDLVVVVMDEHIDKFFPNTDWILPMGKIFAIEQYPGDFTMTSRICLDGYRRFDCIFIKYSDFEKLSKWNFNPIGREYKILFSKIKNINTILDCSIKEESFKEPEYEVFKNMANNFWFKGVVAIAKISRGDYLISSHLALEMAQDCIVLQMMLRDREKGTNIHRFGWKENVEILSNIKDLGEFQPPKDIIKIIESSSIIFDKLAKLYSTKYVERYSEFKQWLDDLKKENSK